MNNMFCLGIDCLLTFVFLKIQIETGHNKSGYVFAKNWCEFNNERKVLFLFFFSHQTQNIPQKKKDRTQTQNKQKHAHTN